MSRRGLLVAAQFNQWHGTTVHVWTLAAELARRGFPITGITQRGAPQQDSDFPVELIRWHRWPSKRPTSWRDFAAVTRAIAASKPAAVMATFGAVNVTLAAATILRVPHRLAWFQTLSSQNELDGGAPVKRTWQVLRKRLAYAAATHLLAISQAAADDLKHSFHQPAKKIEVFYLGVKDRWDERWERIFQARQRHEVPRLLCVCRMHPSKGPQVLLEAAAHLKARGVPFEVRMVGEGPLLGQLQNRATEAGLQREFQFPGLRKGKDLEEELAEATLLLVPSLEEAFGLMVLEGLAAGLPVVAFRTGAVPELMEDGRHGVLVGERSASALADVVAAILASAETRARMGRAGRQHFLTHFDLEAVVRTQADRLCELLQGAEVRRKTFSSSTGKKLVS